MKVAAVLPSYKVQDHILNVLNSIGPDVHFIYVVDDCCPNGSGNKVLAECKDPRVRVLFNEKNLGVGGATITGYKHAVQDGANIIVKIDGDGQMNPKLIANFIKPIRLGIADYTKGNRFYSPHFLKQMPLIRKIGNAGLSLFAKISTGYWNIMDPTNGFTAIHGDILKLLDLEKIDQRYFFESDLLFRLNIIGAAVQDVPMEASYGNETSHLNVVKSLWEFAVKHLRNAAKRYIYKYFIRDFNVATVQFFFGFLAMGFGAVFGAYHWHASIKTQAPATTGTVMVATLPIILGFQLVLSAFSYDVSNYPTRPLHPFLDGDK